MLFKCCLFFFAKSITFADGISLIVDCIYCGPASGSLSKLFAIHVKHYKPVPSYDMDGGSNRHDRDSDLGDDSPMVSLKIIFFFGER